MQVDALKWTDVPSRHLVMKGAVDLATTAVARTADAASVDGILARTVERRLARVLRDADREHAQFTLPVAYGLQLFRGHLDLVLDMSVLSSRLHDWVQSGGLLQHSSSYFVCLGSWDHLLSPAKRSAVMREAIELHQARLDYRATPSYARYIALADARTPVTRNQIALSSPQRIADYYERFVALYRSIEAHGVLPMRRVPQPVANRFLRRGLPSWVLASGERDIGVAIGPQGATVLLPGGKHRLAVAIVLGIHRVPVEVRMLHLDWIRRLPTGGRHSLISAIEDGLEGLRAT